MKKLEINISQETNQDEKSLIKILLHFDKMYKIYGINNQSEDEVIDYINNDEFIKDWQKFCKYNQLCTIDGVCSINNINSAVLLILQKIKQEEKRIGLTEEKNQGYLSDYFDLIKDSFLLFIDKTGYLIIVEIIKKSIKSILEQEKCSRKKRLIHSTSKEVENILFEGNLIDYEKYNPFIFLNAINQNNIDLIKNDMLFFNLIKDLNDFAIDYLLEIVSNINILNNKYFNIINSLFETIIACGYGYKIYEFLFNLDNQYLTNIFGEKNYIVIFDQLYKSQLADSHKNYREKLIELGFRIININKIPYINVDDFKVTFKKGDKVFHSQFGKGEIIRISGKKYTIKFAGDIIRDINYGFFSHDEN